MSGGIKKDTWNKLCHYFYDFSRFHDIQNPYDSSIMFASLIYFFYRGYRDSGCPLKAKKIKTLYIRAPSGEYLESNILDLRIPFNCKKK